MRSIQIDSVIKEKCGFLRLACMSCEVKVQEKSKGFDEYLQTLIEKRKLEIDTASIKASGPVYSSREAYKKLGKEPSRYRLSAEALQRRIAQGKDIYRINNVVDILNSISLRFGFSIGGYDDARIEGAVTLGIGKEAEPFEAIGRGALNISNLPTLRDQVGAFGTPTSDSLRTMVRPATQRFLMILYSFAAGEPLEEAMEESSLLLRKYAAATHFETGFVQ